VIDRRQLLVGAAAGAALLATRRALAAAPTPADVRALYRGAVVIDMLSGLVVGADGRVDDGALRVIRESGLTAINVTVTGAVEDWDETVSGIAWLTGEAARLPKHLVVARTAAELAAARRQQRLALILGSQGSLGLGRELGRIDVLADLGLRVFQLTYNRGDLVGDGCLEPRDAGVTTFGKEVIARLDQRRIAIDLSHCGARTTREAIALSKRPVLITHSGCSAVFAHPRNKDDATLKALADKGGVLGIYLMPFLGRPAAGGPSTAAMALDHIEHAIKVCGEDHVGIGTDGGIEPVAETAESRREQEAFVAERRRRGISAPEEERPLYVPELNTARRYETIALGLAKRGHSLRVIEKVLGLGFQRALVTIWGS
jgi:membrane dipeptidase